MTPKNWLLAGVEAVLWYIFVVYFLFVLKNDVSIFQSALILLILAYSATIVCPWFRNTDAWQKLWRKD